MPDLTGFWDVIDAQLTELTTARTADDVLRILATGRAPIPDPFDHDPFTSAPAFFAGSGGDGRVYGALVFGAGWRVIWQETSYYYALAAPDGQSVITYIEGDIYPEDRRPA